MTFRTTPLAAASLTAASLVWAACSSAPQPPPGPPSLPSDPSQLRAPSPGQGVQLLTDAFAVPAGTEYQACYFFKLGDLMAANGFDATQPFELHHIQVVQKTGSHHMNVHRVRTVKGVDPTKGTVVGTNGQGECFNSANFSDWPLVANSQSTDPVDWTYPDGVANELRPDEWLMLQTHYVNASTQGTPDSVGQVAVNLLSMAPAEVTAQMGTLFATNQNIRICKSNQAPSFSTTCQFHSSQPVAVIGANGHFHSRGTQFDMFVWNGMSTTPPSGDARFYQSLAWDEPPMPHSPALEVQVPAGGGVWYTCDYQWRTPPDSIGCQGLDSYDQGKKLPNGQPPPSPDCCYRFGPQVDLNEHCNAFVYYYPKQDDVNCF